MARYTGPKCKQCRREGEKLFLKGDRCEGQKCAITRRNYAPGQLGKNRFGKLTEYARHLRAKQKARRIYGISENQFSLYYQKADKKQEATGLALLKLLETRLDNVIYRAGFAKSRTQARQIVTHGHIKLNGRRVDIPSIQVKVGDKFEAREGSKKNPLLAKATEDKKFKSPDWLKIDLANLQGEVISDPSKDDAEAGVDTQLIVEFYSK
ncbi:MAG: 30S ribosomal protein S4 [uncultured bacterium]|nr:MAG: 30S ribosomal protein S4 [uncultured bacterium]